MSRLSDDGEKEAAGCRSPAAAGPEIREMKAALRKLMWEKVGIIRCAESLSIARERLAEWLPLADTLRLTREEQELKNMVTVAALITEAALARKESVGAHYRSDFPSRGKDWSSHITCTRDSGSVPLCGKVLQGKR
jgi:aspartate oxidase